MSNFILIGGGPQLPPSYSEATGNPRQTTDNESNFVINQHLECIESYLPVINAEIQDLKNRLRYRVAMLDRMNSKINVINSRNGQATSCGDALAIGLCAGLAYGCTANCLEGLFRSF